MGETVQSCQYFWDDVVVDVLTPEDIKMLVAVQTLRKRMTRELRRHRLDVHQAVRVAPEKNDGRGNVPCREARWAI